MHLVRPTRLAAVSAAALMDSSLCVAAGAEGAADRRRNQNSVRLMGPNAIPRFGVSLSASRTESRTEYVSMARYAGANLRSSSARRN